MRKLVNSYTKKDFKIDFFSGSGAGGQHRNKHQNCVRITHLETKISAVGQDHKSRKRNIEDAMKRIADEMQKQLMDDLVQSMHRDNRSNETVRTYNVEDNRVVDHATGIKTEWAGLDLDTFLTTRLLKVKRPDDPIIKTDIA